MFLYFSYIFSKEVFSKNEYHTVVIKQFKIKCIILRLELHTIKQWSSYYV
jgi:hypothetical protein